MSQPNRMLSTPIGIDKQNVSTGKYHTEKVVYKLHNSKNPHNNVDRWKPSVALMKHGVDIV